MSDQDRLDVLERQVALLENHTLSLNNLCKLIVIMQGPTFTDTAIKNLEIILSSNPNDPVMQDAKSDLEESKRTWEKEAGGLFGLEALMNKLEGLEARQSALQFIMLLNTLQHGPTGMNAMLQALENRKVRDEANVSEAFQVATDRVFEYFKSEIGSALMAFVRQSVKENQGREEEEVSRV